MKANYSVIVYGKTGCGKSTNAERIRAHLGLAHVVDDFDPLGRTAVCMCGVLYLTADMRVPKMRKNSIVKALAYDKVMAEIEAAAPSEPTTLEKLIEQAPNLALTGWIPCTTPPVRDGEYEFTMFPEDDNPGAIRGEYRAGKWVDRPGIDECPSEFYWRGVRRWVLVNHALANAQSSGPYVVTGHYMVNRSAFGAMWGSLANAKGFDTAQEALAYRDKGSWPFGLSHIEAVLP